MNATTAELNPGRAELHAELRAAAQGSTHREAATELLIRAGLADPIRPWIVGWPTPGARIDLSQMAAAASGNSLGGYMSSRRTIVTVAAGLFAEGEDVAIPATGSQVLDAITYLDTADLDLVLAAIAHAAGPAYAPAPGTDGSWLPVPCPHPWPDPVQP